MIGARFTRTDTLPLESCTSGKTPTMARITNTPSNEQLQYVALAVLSLGAAGATGILSLSQCPSFQP
jgi:hypothetical protein